MGAPDHPGASHFTPAGNIAVYVDRTVLAPWSRLSPGTDALPFDNQGLLSTVAAVVTALLGGFAGEYVRGTRGRVSGECQTVVLLAAAGALAVSAERIRGYRTTFSSRANADGTVTILAAICEDGLAVIFR